MTKQIHDHLARGEARIVDAPARGLFGHRRSQVEHDRNFGMPTAFYGATVGLYLAFLAVTFAGFGNPELVIPMVIFAVFIVGGFGVPAIWTRLRGNATRPLTMGEFGRKGIMTHTGRLAPRDAAIQMLILPVLIVLWGCVTVTIAAIVS